MDHGRLSLIVLLIIFVLGGVCLARYSGGSGESNSPYEISTANDLNDIHKYTEDCNKHFVVTADIDMNGFDFNSALIGRDTNPSQGGFQGSSFTGSFDGMDHVVRNLRVEAASNYYIGLFGRIGHEGRVSNLRLEDISVTGKGSTGGLAGYNHGRISNCYVSGYINGGDSVGGLVGFDNGRIENCSVAVTVQGDWYAGGLVGQCGGLIYDCNALGNVNGSNYVGGLAGYCEMSDVWDSNSGCDVNGTDYVGG